MEDRYHNSESASGGEASGSEPTESEKPYGAVLVALLLLSGALFFLIGNTHTCEGESRHSGGSSVDRDRQLSGLLPSRFVMSRRTILDTVYTTDSAYLEVNLAKQLVTAHFRSFEPRTFRISSGNPFIKEGMATPTGLFTIQNKVPMAISRQFDDARLHWWIGVQGGIGFHGLDGNGYYRHLGNRPSSHGCMRMAREEIAEMYSLVRPGMLILVHDGRPARVVAFCHPTDTAGAKAIDSAAVYDRNLGRDRLQTLYSGRYWTQPSPRLVHIAGQRFRWGISIGDVRRIPRQELPPDPLLRPMVSVASFGGMPDEVSVSGFRQRLLVPALSMIEDSAAAVPDNGVEG